MGVRIRMSVDLSSVFSQEMPSAFAQTVNKHLSRSVDHGMQSLSCNGERRGNGIPADADVLNRF